MSSIDQGQPTAEDRPGSLLRQLLAVRLGLAGQVLTFAAMVLPILLREVQQVYVLVFASAVMTLLGNAAPLAYPFLYPVIRGPWSAHVATVWSSITVGAVCAAVLLCTPLEDRLGLPAGTFAATAALLAAFELYLLATTRAVRADDMRGIGLARIVYGLVLLAATTAACLLPVGPLGLTLGTALAFTVSGLAVGMRPLVRPFRTPRPRSRAVRRRLRRAFLARAARPTLSALANGWTGCLPGLALPGLGPAAGSWAVASRICGGYGTVLLVVLAPVLEARLSRSIRDRDHAAFGAARRSALLIGAAVTLVALVTALLLTGYATYDHGLDPVFWTVALATLLFWGPLLTTAAINRLPNFLGRHTARLIWDTSRAVLLTAAFLAAEGSMRLLLMGVVTSLSALFLIPMSRWRISAAPVPAGAEG